MTRRIFLTMALASCFLFAFSTVAMAKYAGYASQDATSGYLLWDDATLLNPTQGTSPHGGYRATTVKCPVCHSAHRAASDQVSAGVGSYWKLTPGGDSCIVCHTASGANPSDKLVEWPSTYTDGGPHQSFDCMGQCHSGIHGAVSSDYGVARQFLLNPALDAGLSEAIAAGNVNASVSDANLTNGIVNKATRATVTGYVCAQSGCHTSSQFAVNTEGYAGMRHSQPSDTSGAYDVALTGHETGSTSTHCSTGGCHSVPNDVNDSNCATCHDFRGRATNSTAWPHANRAVEVYEWVRTVDGTLTTQFATPTQNNLWMYTGDVTFRDTSLEPTQTLMWDGKTGSGVSHGSDVEGLAPNRVNTRTVLQGNAAFDVANNMPGNIQDGVCLKCHSYGYGPYHGEGSLGNPASSQYERNFGNY